jgi:intein/homing endonuclease/multimeric flavodoxin WrbA
METFNNYIESKSTKTIKPRIVVIQGSPRTRKSCSGGDSKTIMLIKKIIEQLGDQIKIDLFDLCVRDDEPKVQPCKGCISTSNGYQCHFPCIESSQRVHLQNGFKEIENVKVGDILQDGNKVTKHFLTAKDEKIYELKLNDGRCLKLTSNHKVKTFTKQRFRDKSSNFSYYRKEEWKELKDLSVGDFIPSIELSDKLNKKKTKNDYLYSIYGLIWGDGTLCQNSAFLYVDAREKEFINQIKEKYQKDIVSILPHKISNPCLRDSQQNKTEMIKINFGTKIGKKFKKLFTKNKATERRLNFDAFKNKNQILNFLNGWISTDGSIHGSYAIIYNTSYELLRDTQLLLSRLSIRSNLTDLRHLKTNIRNKEYQRCSSLTISDQDSMQIIKNEIKLIHPKKQSKLSECGKKSKLKHNFTKIKSITQIGTGDVYDIEVENSHSFNCEGIKVHNCSCFSKNSDKEPDYMHDKDVYNKMEKADGFIVFSPVHWYAITTQVKAFFDRLVCVNLTLTVDQAKKYMGENIKNPEITRKLEKSGQYSGLLKNHYEGKVGAFFIHGNNGANDYANKKLPLSLTDYHDEEKNFSIKDSVMPIVHQCRYSGIFVPDNLIQCHHIGENDSYAEGNDKFKEKEESIYVKKGLKLFQELISEINKLKAK